MMESSVNDEMEDGGSLLNQANAGPFSVIEKALHLWGPDIRAAPSGSYMY